MVQCCTVLWAKREFQVHHTAGSLPAIFREDDMKELSVFVDESGDFGPYSSHSPYYLFALVFHEQENPINEAVNILDNRIKELGFDIHAIHTGPIIRNENYYRNYLPEERKRLFNELLFFTKKVDIKYHVVSAEKPKNDATNALVDLLSKGLAVFLREKIEYFQSFDRIIVYYDYGQSEITKILTSVFNYAFINVEFRHVRPNEYKLFQVADMICTLELSRLNYADNRISKSENNFYEGYRRFKDFYYKTISKKKI